MARVGKTTVSGEVTGHLLEWLQATYLVQCGQALRVTATIATILLCTTPSTWHHFRSQVNMQPRWAKIHNVYRVECRLIRFSDLSNSPIHKGYISCCLGMSHASLGTRAVLPVCTLRAKSSGNRLAERHHGAFSHKDTVTSHPRRRHPGDMSSLPRAEELGHDQARLNPTIDRQPNPDMSAVLFLLIPSFTPCRLSSACIPYGRGHTPQQEHHKSQNTKQKGPAVKNTNTSIDHQTKSETEVVVACKTITS